MINSLEISKMKALYFLFASVLLLFSCSKDDNDSPSVVNPILPNAQQCDGVTFTKRVGAFCNDNSRSTDTSSTACSNNGGLNYWLCEEGPPAPHFDVMELSFSFKPIFNGMDLNSNDTILYENISGNILSVNSLQYLISNIQLNDWNFSKHEINEYHLVDVNDPSTQTFVATDSIKVTDYSSISLFLGFNEAENITGEYPDLDNKGWGWPPKWEGGYYTLKMDGRFLSTSTSTLDTPYDMAVGGNILKVAQDTLYVPLDPVLVATLGNSGFTTPDPIVKVNIEVIIDVNKLFESTQGIANYNLDVFTNNIEEDANGSAILAENIKFAFSLGAVTFE